MIFRLPNFCSFLQEECVPTVQHSRYVPFSIVSRCHDYPRLCHYSKRHFSTSQKPWNSFLVFGGKCVSLHSILNKCSSFDLVVAAQNVQAHSCSHVWNQGKLTKTRPIKSANKNRATKIGQRKSSKQFGTQPLRGRTH